MSWVIDIARNLPDFMTYVVPGYLFLSVYRYILFKDEKTSEHTTAILLNSIAVSFVLRTVFDSILSSDKVGITAYLLCLFVFSTVSAYLVALLIRWPKTENAMRSLGINRTIHNNIWDDILQPDVCIRVWLKDCANSYYGQIKYIDNHAREPLLVLVNYQYLDEDEEMIVDNSNNPKRTVLLNLSQFECVEIVEK